ncbi:hypothetical protein ABL78_5302 [Leptomonas seymouri]|uniref:Uncharacterized protein n=1 Tax=Leptomonas seymouri TaxID=5684 RepID=A0A0N1I2C2_LEPSE|nr:hypothetical protein ABL78_5302 [Leptomonas seymouri]|eukprot:KPI85621.1 hypothetical protein ABL78_5302 [Leptomonas seymouri]
MEVPLAPSALVTRTGKPPLTAAVAVLKCVDRNPLFGLAVYDFFRSLGTVTVAGKEVIRSRVATTLLRAIDPDLPSLIASRNGRGLSDSAEEFLSEVELRNCVLTFCVNEVEKSSHKKQRHAKLLVSIAVKRMSDFVETSRRALLRLQRQPAQWSGGFWVHRSVQPRVVLQWNRCWAKMSVKGDALSVCAPGSFKSELHIPFACVVRCYRECRAAGAPLAYARHGLVFQLTAGNPPLQVVVCPEIPDACEGLLASLRAWSSVQNSSRPLNDGVLAGSSRTSSKLLGRQTEATIQGFKTIAVWSLMKGTSVYEEQSWVVEDDALRMTSLSSQQACVYAVADITAIVEEAELPVAPHLRTACGFVLCLRSGSSILAFTEHPQERTYVVEHIYRSQLLLQLSSMSAGGA